MGRVCLCNPEIKLSAIINVTPAESTEPPPPHTHFHQPFGLIFFLKTSCLLHCTALTLTNAFIHKVYRLELRRVKCLAPGHNKSMHWPKSGLHFGFVDKCSACRVHNTELCVSTSTKCIKCFQIVYAFMYIYKTNMFVK